MIRFGKTLDFNLAREKFIMMAVWQFDHKSDQSYDLQFGKLYDGKVVLYTAYVKS